MAPIEIAATKSKKVICEIAFLPMSLVRTNISKYAKAVLITADKIVRAI
jgi:hypothetical protein